MHSEFTAAQSRSLYSQTGALILLRCQEDMARCKTIKDEVQQQMEKVDVDMDRLRNERAQFELKAARTQEETKKV